MTAAELITAALERSGRLRYPAGPVGAAVDVQAHRAAIGVLLNAMVRIADDDCEAARRLIKVCAREAGSLAAPHMADERRTLLGVGEELERALRGELARLRRTAA